jgi:hypothetical protein
LTLFRQDALCLCNLPLVGPRLLLKGLQYPLMEPELLFANLELLLANPKLQSEIATLT